jgi:NAD(P)-dependent dehydrogenase (short-subunit alcohol dehydrogenase family)
VPSAPATAKVAEPAAEPAADLSVLIPPKAVRAVVEVVDVGAVVPAAVDLGGRRVVVTHDADPAAPALVKALGERGAEVSEVALGALDADGRFPAGDQQRLAGADGVVHLASGAGAPVAFAALAPAGLAGAGWLIGVTRDGTTGGEPGLLRSLAWELPDRVVRSVQVAADASAELVAAAVIDELAQPAGPVDSCPIPGTRRTRIAMATERPSGATGALPPFERSSVVLVTGGARGITARFAVALAEAGVGHLELVGRSALPTTDEPADLAAAADVRALRQAVLARGDAKTPAQVEEICRRLLAEREVRATMAAIGKAGASVRYHQLDVRNTGHLAAVVAGVYEHHGRIDGVVHGAGVIEDRFLADKTWESYQRVYETKVGAARTLLGAVRDDIGFVVLFGSVSGVFGNRGQVDYAAANDALDALARSAAPGGGLARLAGRVLAVDWGPWGGGTGMVAPELAREYARRGVGLIEPDDGVALLGEELAAARAQGGRFPASQVVVARAWPERFAPPAASSDRS